MILVDTSVWIDFLEGLPSVESKQLENLLKQDQPIAIIPIIMLEILQGIRDESIYNQIKQKLFSLNIFSIIDSDYMDAVDIYRSSYKNGMPIRKGVDAIIAATCIRLRLELLHKDKDFEKIASLTRLKRYKP